MGRIISTDKIKTVCIVCQNKKTDISYFDRNFRHFIIFSVKITKRFCDNKVEIFGTQI